MKVTLFSSWIKKSSQSSDKPHQEKEDKKPQTEARMMVKGRGFTIEASSEDLPALARGILGLDDPARIAAKQALIDQYI